MCAILYNRDCDSHTFYSTVITPIDRQCHPGSIVYRARNRNKKTFLRVHLYYSESDIASRWVHRESYMFALSSFRSIINEPFFLFSKNNSSGSKSATGTRTPLTVEILLFSCRLAPSPWELAPLPREILDPPLNNLACHWPRNRRASCTRSKGCVGARSARSRSVRPPCSSLRTRTPDHSSPRKTPSCLWPEVCREGAALSAVLPSADTTIGGT